MHKFSNLNWSFEQCRKFEIHEEIIEHFNNHTQQPSHDKERENGRFRHQRTNKQTNNKIVNENEKTKLWEKMKMNNTKRKSDPYIPETLLCGRIFPYIIEDRDD
jgi:hypothetical protein